MDLAPRPTIDDGLIEGRPCFVCGARALHTVHLEGIPDYVACSDCQSAFVLDLTGDWLMYGKIHTDYLETRRVALRQWASPEEVMRLAAEDRRLAAVELAAESLPEVEELETDDLLPIDELTAETAMEVDDLEAAVLPALFARGMPLDQEPPAREESSGIPLEEEGDLDDFASRLAALAGVPIEDLLFDAEGEPGSEEPLRRSEFASAMDVPSPGGEPSDDWLVLPGEPSPEPAAPLPADGPVLPRSLWHAEQPGIDIFAISPLVDLPPAPEPAEAPIASPAQSAPPPDAAAPPAEPPTAQAEPTPAQPESEAPSDPPPGFRYRTVIRGTRVHFPGGSCAHCMATPARRKLNVRGTLPAGQVLGQRRPTRFAIPLCSLCHKRANSRTPEERSTRLQAYLISALVALFVLIVTLLLDVVNLQGGDVVSGLLLLIILILGYAIPALMLSNRANRFLPPEDALYVQSTLLVPDETQGLETAFEWRNHEYADRFLDANQEAVLGRAIQVKDRSALSG